MIAWVSLVTSLCVTLFIFTSAADVSGIETSAKDFLIPRQCVNHSDGHSPLMVTWVWWCDTQDKKHKYFTMSLVTRAISSRVSLPARNRPDHLFTLRARHMFSVHMTGAHCSLVTMCFMSRRFPVVFLKSKFVVYLFFLTISWSPGSVSLRHSLALNDRVFYNSQITDIWRRKLSYFQHTHKICMQSESF